MSQLCHCLHPVGLTARNCHELCQVQVQPCRPWTLCFLCYTSGTTLSSVCFLQSDDHSLPTPAMHVISLLLVLYVHDAADDTFKKLSDLPPEVPTQIHNALKALHQIEQGTST